MRIAAALLLVFLSLELSGCGKRARHLDPPEGSAPVQYPKHYPPADTSGTKL